MGMTYQDLLSRLKEERKRHHYSQEQVGFLLKISQSHYSKVEMGKRRLTYYETQYLCETTMDVHYIFTGTKQDENSCLDAIHIDKDRMPHAVCMLCIFLQQKSGSGWMDNEPNRIDRLSSFYMNVIVENKNIFYIARFVYGKSQKEFADLLHIDTKKLGSLEKGAILPDSEMIWRLYSSFHISPAIVLNDYKGMRNDLSYLYGLLNVEERDSFNMVFRCMAAE